MIYRFIAARTITARMAVEAPTLEEAKKRVTARALAGLDNSDFPQRGEEHIHFRDAFMTWEGATAAGIDSIVQADDPHLQGGLELLAFFDHAKTPDKAKSLYAQAIQEENPVAYSPLGQAEEWKEE